MLFGHTQNASGEHTAERHLQGKTLQRFAGKLEGLGLVCIISFNVRKTLFPKFQRFLKSGFLS